MGVVWDIIVKIPICGGYLADTNAPKDTCLSRFSNEETVPQPCLRSKTCRIFFEHNIFLRSFGRIGFQWADEHRSVIMLSAFFFSTVGWAFTIAACVAYTDSDESVRSTYWGWGDVDDGSLSYFVGLQRVLFKGGASESDSLSGVNGLNWGTDSDDDDNDVCDLSLTWASKTHGGEMVASTEGLPVAHCGTCEKAANGIIRLVVVGCITQVFQMTTDLQRTTRYGDLNCQKLFGCVTSIYGLISTWMSLVEFRVACGLAHTLPPWVKTYPIAVTLLSSGTPSSVDVSFYAGPGYVLLFLATLLKAYDAICHILVPTPPANHRPIGDHHDQEGEEKDGALNRGFLPGSSGGGGNDAEEGEGGGCSPRSGGDENDGGGARPKKKGDDHWTELADYMHLSVVGGGKPKQTAETRLMGGVEPQAAIEQGPVAAVDSKGKTAPQVELAKTVP